MENIFSLGKRIPKEEIQANGYLGEQILYSRIQLEQTPLIFKLSDKLIEQFVNLETFSTDFTQRLIQTQDFDQCGNGFDELLETKRYKKLLKHQSLQDFHITGSGSVFWSVDRFEIPNCECIETTFF